jgi:hypothetical protein
VIRKIVRVWKIMNEDSEGTLEHREWFEGGI